MSNVDESRKKLIDSMSSDQKDMYLIGMCYHSAFLSFLELRQGKPLNLVGELELKSVIDAMNRQNLKSELTT